MSSGETRASDAEREQIVAQLRDASTEGRLTLEELAERVDAAYAARTHGELERVTADLPAAGAAPAPAAPVRAARRRLVAIFGGVNRRGRWRVPRHAALVCVFGGADLDLRQAEFEGAEATFRVFVMFGGANFVLPPGVQMENEVVPIFGGCDEHGDPGSLTPAAPRVRLTGLALFGGVSVKYRGHR